MWPGLATEDAFFTFRLHLGSFWESFDGSWRLLGSDWAQWLKIAVLGFTFGAPGLHFGWAWQLLDCLWRSLGVNLGASGIQNGCWMEVPMADIAKTIENHRFSSVLEGRRVILEVCRSS